MMVERALEQEFHRVADRVAVPTDLFPSDLMARQRRRGWRTATVAVAAALTLFLFTAAMGPRLVAAGKYLWHYAVAVIFDEAPSSRLPFLDVGAVQVGQQVSHEALGGLKQVAVGMTLGDLQAADPTWPLPTYLAPGAMDRVVLLATSGPDGERLAEGMTADWEVTLGAERYRIIYSLTRRTQPMTSEELERVRSSSNPPVTVYSNDAKLRVEQQTVKVKGQEATAVQVNGRWSLHWWHAGGGGTLSSNLGLAELIRVADSLEGLE